MRAFTNFFYLSKASGKNQSDRLWCNIRGYDDLGNPLSLFVAPSEVEDVLKALAFVNIHESITAELDIRNSGDGFRISILSIERR